jgi:hypothetical protein
MLYARIFCTKILFCQNVTREKLRKALLYKKCVRKMLMKLTPVEHCITFWVPATFTTTTLSSQVDGPVLH